MALAALSLRSHQRQFGDVGVRVAGKGKFYRWITPRPGHWRPRKGGENLGTGYSAIAAFPDPIEKILTAWAHHRSGSQPDIFVTHDDARARGRTLLCDVAAQIEAHMHTHAHTRTQRTTSHHWRVSP